MKKLSINRWWHCVLAVATISILVTACNKSAHKAPAPQASTAQTKKEPEAQSQIMTPKEKRSFYTWLLNEMHQQVYVQPFPDLQEMLNWLNVLEQGGSVEGVYHGMVLSTQYMDKEKDALAKDDALRFFAEESVLLSLEKQVLDTKSSAAVDQLLVKMPKTSIYTLKREMGESILKLVSAKKGDRNKLADWYADVATRWSAKKIPFGIAERNKEERSFHYQWAMDNSVELLQWELLNRTHRILNQTQGLVLVLPPPAKDQVAGTASPAANTSAAGAGLGTAPSNAGSPAASSVPMPANSAPGTTGVLLPPGASQK